MFYAYARVPVEAPIDAREAAARTAANYQQALGWLVPLAEQIALQGHSQGPGSGSR